MKNKTAVANFKVLFQKVFRGTDENHKK